MPDRVRYAFTGSKRKANCLVSNRCLIRLGLLLFLSIGLSTAGAELSVEGRDAENASECLHRLPEFRMGADAFLALAESINTNRYGVCPISLNFSGDITIASINELRQTVDVIVQKLSPPVLLINLNSNGGDVWAALDFAKHVRKMDYRHVIMNVVKDNFCRSSCVLILSGGYQRHVSGNVGIHRPFFTGSRAKEAGYTNLKEAYDALYEELQAFFSAANLSNRLVDDMWQVPSHTIKHLSRSELDQYGLTRDDAIVSEMENANLRSECGIEAPAYKKDYLSEVITPCLDNELRLDRECANRKGRSHPFCKCLAKLNPDWGVVCTE